MIDIYRIFSPFGVLPYWIKFEIFEITRLKFPKELSLSREDFKSIMTSELKGLGYNPQYYILKILEVYIGI